MKVYFDERKQRVPIKSWCEEPQPGALDQAVRVSRHPAVFGHVALMPDAHEGFGMPIGGVAALDGAVSPNMVGVDIACGMMAVRLDVLSSETGRDVLEETMRRVRERVPMGFAHQRDSSLHIKEAKAIYEKHEGELPKKGDGAKLASPGVISEQLGTLGGGNHFIEIQRDEAGAVWVMMHSGSRNIGKQVCSLYNRKALDFAEREKVKGDRSIAALPSESAEGREYLALMNLCVDFSFKNRELMMVQVVESIRDSAGRDVEILESVNIHHNYASFETHFGRGLWVHRKGATLATKDTAGVIPGSMGTKSYIVAGRGCEESLQSCSHGAGRAMSRGEAKRLLSMKELKREMGDIVFPEGKSILDEAPMAYKKIESVMSQQADLVKIVHELRPLAVEKG